MKKKLNKVYKIQYVLYGFVQILIIFFAVMKVIRDIHIVYYRIASGLKMSVWVPNFGLQTL